MSNPYLYDTGWKFDAERLKKDVDKILQVYPLSGFNSQTSHISLVHAPGDPDPYKASSVSLDTPETVFAVFNKRFQGMYVHEVYKELNQLLEKPLGRMRIMRLPAGRSYRFHTDYETRYHIATHTNPNVLFYIKDPYYEVHIPADGKVWFLDTTAMHRVANNSNEDRLHVVFIST